MSDVALSSKERDFEPGFKDALHSLRKLKRRSERHNDFNGPMKLWSSEVMILVDCALSMLDREDAAVAKKQLLENFRYE